MICLTLTTSRISMRNLFDRCRRALRPSISYSLCNIALQYWRSSQKLNDYSKIGDEEISIIQQEKLLVNSENLLLDDRLFPYLIIDPMCGAGSFFGFYF